MGRHGSPTYPGCCRRGQSHTRVIESSIWDLSPAWTELRSLWRQTIQGLPLFLLALALLLLTWFATLGAVRLAHLFLTPRMPNRLLLGVAEKVFAVPVFLLGLYIVLRVSGLTQLALTILGGTGVIGLVIGIAFRDIAENFLASLLISTRNPFRSGDLIEVADHLGYVQKVTSRGTVLMTFEGNYVQIPNAMIYKNTLLNYSANPNIRLDFVIGIGYDSSIADAQQVALDVLRAHPSVLDTPEPMVLVEQLGAATINLRIHFWVDCQHHSGLRVKSSVMRLTVRAFEEAGISLPDEAREVIFPQGIPIRTLEDTEDKSSEIVPQRKSAQQDNAAVSTAAEGDLRSEASDLQDQVKHEDVPEQGQDLLTQ